MSAERVLTKKRFDEIQMRFDDNRKIILSNYFCELLAKCEKNEKITIATTEVQIRLLLDNRFFVASLDGITDYKLSEFIEKKWLF